MQSLCMSSPLLSSPTAMSLLEHFALQYGSMGHQSMGWHLPPSSSDPAKGSGLFPSRLIQA